MAGLVGGSRRSVPYRDIRRPRERDGFEWTALPRLGIGKLAGLGISEARCLNASRGYSPPAFPAGLLLVPGSTWPVGFQALL